MTHKTVLLTRRSFIESSARWIVTIPLLNTLAGRSWSADLPIETGDDPVAKALGYFPDATKVDTVKYPKRAGADGATQFCHTCLQFTATSDDWGTCKVIPGKRVAAAGWCNVWVKKA
jgi:hypothetical protein